MSTIAGVVGAGVVVAPTVARGESVRGNRVPGLWQVNLVIQEQDRLERTLWRLSEDGTFMHSSDNGGTGLGSWAKLGPDAFTVTFRGFVLSTLGVLEGQLMVRERCVFTTPDTISITSEARFSTPDGVEVGTFHAIGTGTRARDL